MTSAGATTAVFDDPDGFTPEWMSAALTPRIGAHDLRSVTATRVGTGQIGTSYRLTLEWSDPTSARAAGAPDRLVAKLAGGDPASRSVVAEGYRNEIGFYTEVAATVAIDAPACWYAAISDDNTSFVLLMDDLAPAEPGQQVRGCTLDEARAAVRNLAGLHGPRWQDPTLWDIAWLQRQSPESAEFLGQILAGAVPTFLERFGDALDDDTVATIEAVPGHVPAWLMTRPERYSLIHGDYRPDNLMFMPDGSRVSTVDWQTLGLGLPGRDVGYFLATSLDPAARARHERELVGTYHEALLAHGVTGFDLEECLEDYRLGVLQGPLITVLGAVYATAEPTPESNAMFLAMITRSAAAIRELEPFTLL